MRSALTVGLAGCLLFSCSNTNQSGVCDSDRLGETRCRGSDVQQCFDTGWVKLIDCAQNGLRCGPELSTGNATCLLLEPSSPDGCQGAECPPSDDPPATCANPPCNTPDPDCQTPPCDDPPPSTDPCPAGQSRCANYETIETCVTGGWSPTACGLGRHCETLPSGAACVADDTTGECTEGAEVCLGATHSTCVGGQWQTAPCEFGCLGVRCAPHPCDTGIHAYCDGDETVDCSDGGRTDCLASYGVPCKEIGADDAGCVAPDGTACLFSNSDGEVTGISCGDTWGTPQPDSACVDGHCADDTHACDPSADSSYCHNNLLVYGCPRLSGRPQTYAADCDGDWVKGAVCSSNQCVGAAEGSFCDVGVVCAQGLACSNSRCVPVGSNPSCGEFGTLCFGADDCCSGVCVPGPGICQ